jgi:hypothetical protein
MGSFDLIINIQGVDNKVVILGNMGGAAQPSKPTFFSSSYRITAPQIVQFVAIRGLDSSTLQKFPQKVLDCYLVL